jgi:hypothetical protein
MNEHGINDKYLQYLSSDSDEDWFGGKTKLTEEQLAKYKGMYANKNIKESRRKFGKLISASIKLNKIKK